MPDIDRGTYPVLLTGVPLLFYSVMPVAEKGILILFVRKFNP